MGEDDSDGEPTAKCSQWNNPSDQNEGSESYRQLSVRSLLLREVRDLPEVSF